MTRAIDSTGIKNEKTFTLHCMNSWETSRVIFSEVKKPFMQ